MDSQSHQGSVLSENIFEYEKMIANAMSEIAKREGVYIPPNLQRSIRTSYHKDNYNGLVFT